MACVWRVLGELLVSGFACFALALAEAIIAGIDAVLGVRAGTLVKRLDTAHHERVYVAVPSRSRQEPRSPVSTKLTALRATF